MSKLQASTLDTAEVHKIYSGVYVAVQVAEEAVQRHMGGRSVNWLDHGTEHPHRIALSVHVDSLQDCLSHLRRGFQQHAVQVCLPLPTHYYLLLLDMES